MTLVRAAVAIVGGVVVIPVVVALMAAALTVHLLRVWIEIHVKG